MSTNARSIIITGIRKRRYRLYNIVFTNGTKGSVHITDNYAIFTCNSIGILKELAEREKKNDTEERQTILDENHRAIIQIFKNKNIFEIDKIINQEVKPWLMKPMKPKK
jgi:hypothetical protein